MGKGCYECYSMLARDAGNLHQRIPWLQRMRVQEWASVGREPEPRPRFQGCRVGEVRAYRWVRRLGRGSGAAVTGRAEPRCLGHHVGAGARSRNVEVGRLGNLAAAREESHRAGPGGLRAVGLRPGWGPKQPRRARGTEATMPGAGRLGSRTEAGGGRGRGFTR